MNKKLIPKNIKMKKILQFALLSLLILSCKKFEEGGLVNKTKKRLSAQTWVLSKYLRNGVDETNLVLFINYEEKYTGEESGSFTRTYIDKNGDNKMESGSWFFEKEKKQLNISGISSLEITSETGTVSSTYYNILKLDKKEFWYYYENGGDRQEFHFSKK